MIKEAFAWLATRIEAASPTITAEGRIYKTVPDGHKLEELKKAHKEPLPYISAGVVAESAADLAAYVALFALPAKTLAFASLEGRRVQVVIDYHTKDAPALCEHSATWTQKPSRELLEWKLGAWLSHKQLVQLLDERCDEIVDPAPKRVFDLVESLEVIRKDSRASTVSRNGERAGIKLERTASLSDGKPNTETTAFEPLREITVAIPISAGIAAKVYHLPLAVHWDCGDEGLRVKLTCHELPKLSDGEFLIGLNTLQASGITAINGAR